MCRMQTAVVVGDPLQVEPVVTIPKVLIDILADSTGVANEYKVIENSAQTFADNINEFSGMIGERQVGCPLVVHRRCIEPMFSIDRYHLVVHVWIRNSKGEYLISQRSANRPTYPLMWECVGGSVVKGEDSLLGAIREAKEEVGVDLMPENGQVLFTKTRKIIEGKIFNDIMDVWLFEYDGEVDLGNATTDEVAQAAWMNREQIKELFEQEVFVGTLEYFFTEVDKERR